MLIKYLIDTHDSKAGEVKDVPDMQANVLVLRGFCEKVTPNEENTPKQGVTAKTIKKGA